MKKSILFLFFITISIVGTSQQLVLMNGVNANITGTYNTEFYGGALPGTTGELYLITSSDYIGTTAYDTLQCGIINPNTNITTYSNEYQNDGVTPIVINPKTGSNVYPVKIITSGCSHYRIKHIAGNASSGKITTILILKIR